MVGLFRIGIDKEKRKATQKKKESQRMETNLYPPHRMENTIKIDSATRVPNSRAKTRFARRTRWRRRHR